jgi:hypothetical protein
MFEINLTILFASVVAGAAPIVLAAVGETITEKAGLINLSLDGTILLSAMAAFAVAFETNSLILGFVCGAVVGALVAVTVAVFSIYFAPESGCRGFCINADDPGSCLFYRQSLFAAAGPSGIPPTASITEQNSGFGRYFFQPQPAGIPEPVFYRNLLVVHLPHPPRLEIKIRGRTPPGIICQRHRSPKIAVAVCCLWWIIGGPGRGHVFTGHQTRMGTAPGGGRNRLDRTGPGDFSGVGIPLRQPRAPTCFRFYRCWGSIFRNGCRRFHPRSFRWPRFH